MGHGAAAPGGAFDPLPLAEGCFLTVEQSERSYSWSEASSAEADDEAVFETELRRVEKLTAKSQVEHWICELDEMASGTRKSEHQILEEDARFEQLELLGDVAVVPLLKLARKWADKPEWLGDRPKRKIEQSPSSNILYSALSLCGGSRVAN